MRDLFFTPRGLLKTGSSMGEMRETKMNCDRGKFGTGICSDPIPSHGILTNQGRTAEGGAKNTEK